MLKMVLLGIATITIILFIYRLLIHMISKYKLSKIEKAKKQKERAIVKKLKELEVI